MKNLQLCAIFLFLMIVIDTPFNLTLIQRTLRSTIKVIVSSLFKKNVQEYYYILGFLVTCGEDGAIKIWSKQGIIRSNKIQIDKPIYYIVWSQENDAILCSSDKMIFIKPIQAVSL